MSDRHTHGSGARPAPPATDARGDRQTWEEPRLQFVEPRLVKQGEMKRVTGFFGTFVPNPPD